LGINIADFNDNRLFSFAKITSSPDPEEEGPPIFLITNPSITAQARMFTSGISFVATDANNYTAVGSLKFFKLTGNYYDGYFEFNSPIRVLYPTGHNAASMPEGSILVQGDYLFYKDSNGTWKRAAFYNATPS